MVVIVISIIDIDIDIEIAAAAAAVVVVCSTATTIGVGVGVGRRFCSGTKSCLFSGFRFRLRWAARTRTKPQVVVVVVRGVPHPTVLRCLSVATAVLQLSLAVLPTGILLVVLLLCLFLRRHAFGPTTTTTATPLLRASSVVGSVLHLPLPLLAPQIPLKLDGQHFGLQSGFSGLIRHNFCRRATLPRTAARGGTTSEHSLLLAITLAQVPPTLETDLIACGKQQQQQTLPKEKGVTGLVLMGICPFIFGFLC